MTGHMSLLLFSIEKTHVSTFMVFIYYVNQVQNYHANYVEQFFPSINLDYVYNNSNTHLPDNLLVLPNFTISL